MHVGGDLGRNLDRRIVFPLVEMLTHYVKHYIPRHDACGLDGAYYLSLLVNVWSPTDDRAHAAVSHVGCARRNARQVLPPSSQLRICAQIPQNRGVFKSTEITNVLDNIK